MLKLGKNLICIHFFVSTIGFDGFISTPISIDKFLSFADIARTNSNDFVYNVICMATTLELDAIESFSTKTRISVRFRIQDQILRKLDK
jgi:hypothetical protein